MKMAANVRELISLIFAISGIIVLCASCARITDHPRKAYVVETNGDILAHHAPVFVLEAHRDRYNRIGTPRAHLKPNGKEHVYVDPAEATLCAQERAFRTDQRAYTNLIYRVHFERVPLWHVTAGRNVGLLVIITLNEDEEPVLLTTVSTCGCYLTFIPTTYLSEDAYPAGWMKSQQKAYGEFLPGQLRYPEPINHGYRPVLFLRDETHRIVDVRVEDKNEATWRYSVIPAKIKPMESLKTLPLDGSTTSFYHESGSHKGYVKGARKPLEMLLVSLWAFDSRVGRDKEFSDLEKTRTNFYTSLKFWRRKESDLWHFARCLRYYGWKL